MSARPCRPSAGWYDPPFPLLSQGRPRDRVRHGPACPPSRDGRARAGRQRRTPPVGGPPGLRQRAVPPPTGPGREPDRRWRRGGRGPLIPASTGLCSSATGTTTPPDGDQPTGSTRSAMSTTAPPAAPGRRRRHPVDEVPPPGKLAVYGIQHLLA